FFQAEDGIRDGHVTGVQTCALPIFDLGELAVGAGEADLQAFGFAGPALASGFGDAVVQVGADLHEPGALRGLWPQERAPDAGVRSEERRVGKECRWRWGADS